VLPLPLLLLPDQACCASWRCQCRCCLQQLLRLLPLLPLLPAPAGALLLLP
jgi:hypothetical protein